MVLKNRSILKLIPIPLCKSFNQKNTTKAGLKELKFYCFLLARIEVIMSPKPIPAIMEPTNHNTDSFKTANPIPTPNKVPPPMAQVLLSLSLVAIIFVLVHKSNEHIDLII
jgi:hypothetical protein